MAQSKSTKLKGVPIGYKNDKLNNGSFLILFIYLFI